MKNKLIARRKSIATKIIVNNWYLDCGTLLNPDDMIPKIIARFSTNAATLFGFARRYISVYDQDERMSKGFLSGSFMTYFAQAYLLQRFAKALDHNPGDNTAEQLRELFYDYAWEGSCKIDLASLKKVILLHKKLTRLRSKRRIHLSKVVLYDNGIIISVKGYSCTVEIIRPI